VILPAVIANGHAECALGRIIVTAQHRRGPANIMLRPEQISLTARQAGKIVLPDEPRGEILDVDFSGNVCTVSLRLQNKSGQFGPAISLRQSSVGIPPIGTIVHIMVEGAAHVFREPDPDA
jgi:iron(III) transport system ATP-binding protein